MLENLITSTLSILSSLIGITAIVVFHEFGHFLFCKLFNVYTPTFSIGIGKVLYSKKIGDTDFCLSAGPIGGYVEIATDKGERGQRGFNQIPYYQKFLIMLGGIIFNFLLTYLIFVGLFFTGMPESGIMPYEVNTTTVQSVPKNSINAHHLQAGDNIIAINDVKTEGNARIIKKELLEQSKLEKKEITLRINRSGEEKEILINLNTSPMPQPLNKQLDVIFKRKDPLGLIDSLTHAYSTTIFCLQSIVSGLKEMISSKHTKGFVGPVMAIAVSSKSAQKGFSHLLFLLAIISINLGFMNLLPLPIFDGGQFVIFTIEAITRREMSEKVRNAIGIASWMLAIGLLVLFTLRDVHTLIFG